MEETDSSSILNVNSGRVLVSKTHINFTLLLDEAKLGSFFTASG